LEKHLNLSEVDEGIKLLFEEEDRLTGITEYGVSWEDLLNGVAILPVQGVRFDIAFEGKLTGSELCGTIKGVDFLEVRADGKFILNIQATIITDDGEAIALKEDGVLTPSPDRVAQLHLNMQFSTASANYDWINKKQIWGIGELNINEGCVYKKGYSTN
jgi:hypothetical protein